MENKKLMEWILRISVAGEFIGHGLLAVGGKKDWISWISQMTGADAGLATQLLFWIGVFDVAMAILILIKPVRLVILWMAFWGFWTALVRPLVGVGWLDFVERSANWGAPLTLLLLIGWPKDWREWLH
jgi:hypothetical protein